MVVATLRVRVETGARLHFGFYMLMPIHRLWGGIGMGVDGIGYEVIIEESSSDSIRGCQAYRFHRLLEDARSKLKLQGLQVRLEARRCIPEHRGLGSTTQAALAVYAGLAKLAGLDMDVYRLAQLAERGRISGVGIAVFAEGGFIVDTGRRVGDELSVPKPIVRHSVPDEWRIAYIIPVTTWKVSEDQERAFQGAISYEKQCKLLETVFTELLPSLVERDFASFTDALEALDEMMGEYFAASQGGRRYCCPESELAAELLRREGGKGVGQSSWGPLVYAFYQNEDEAREALNKVVARLEEEGVRLEAYGLLRPRNRGALILVEG